MKNEKASVLILVLWVLIILSLLSMAVSSRSSSDIKLAKYEADSVKSLYLARAGVAKAIAELNKDNSGFTSLNQDWNKEKEFGFGGGVVKYSASDEEGLVNLNGQVLKKENLKSLGMDDNLSDSIMNYKNIKKRDKGFEFMEELFLINGMTKDIYDAIEPYATIYRGDDSKVNINTASENVLMAITGSAIQTAVILDYRDEGGVFQNDTEVSAKELDPNIFSVRSDFFRIIAGASFSEDKEAGKVITAVVDRAGKIYYWKEE
ncbi:MAG: type II secretion system protein GspK [Candidatus Omnitrophota bacterium]|nr:type II secretion system protein GspK [Candidatus Omnitrophota bacterium]